MTSEDSALVACSPRGQTLPWCSPLPAWRVAHFADRVLRSVVAADLPGPPAFAAQGQALRLLTVGFLKSRPPGKGCGHLERDVALLRGQRGEEASQPRRPLRGGNQLLGMSFEVRPGELEPRPSWCLALSSLEWDVLADEAPLRGGSFPRPGWAGLLFIPWSGRQLSGEPASPAGLPGVSDSLRKAHLFHLDSWVWEVRCGTRSGRR